MTHPPSRLLLLAMLFSAPSAATEGGPLAGRLFLTAEQRVMLEQQRARASRSEAEYLRLDGIVRSSTGRGMLWVNGRLREEGSAAQDPDVRIGSAVSGQATLNSGQVRYRLKVGESLAPASGETSDRLEGGRIIVDRHGGPR